jgi:uncharacterized membrane protein YcaP (DUF421 family)
LSELFTLTMSPLELVIRGTIMYLGLVLVMRYILRRDVGSMSMPDVLFIVLVADAAQNAMAGEYKSVADGVVLVGTLVAWNVALDWLAFRFAFFRRIVEAPAVPLIVDGKWMRQNLKKEWITTDEVQSKLREAGIDDIGVVRLAVLEPSGELGIIRRDEGAPARHTKGTALKR